MPRGDKSSYSAKQKRQAAHIEESSKKRGYSTKRAEEIAWATVNKQDGRAGQERRAFEIEKPVMRPGGTTRNAFRWVHQVDRSAQRLLVRFVTVIHLIVYALCGSSWLAR